MFTCIWYMEGKNKLKLKLKFSEKTQSQSHFLQAFFMNVNLKFKNNPMKINKSQNQKNSFGSEQCNMGMLDLVITYLTMLHSSAANTWCKVLYSHLNGRHWKDHKRKKSVRQRVSRLRLQPGTLNLMYDCYQFDCGVISKLHIWVVQFTKSLYG